MLSRALNLTIVAAIFFVWLTTPTTSLAQGPPRQPASAIQEPRAIRDLAKQALDPHDSLCDAILMAGSSGQPATILASVDSSGRRFCNTIARIQIADKPSILWETGTWNVENVSSVMRDVDGDGILELVIPQAFTNYEGARACVAVVPVIYECSTDTCSDASSSFSGFYVTELDNIGRQITLAETRPKATRQEDRFRV